MIEACTSPKDDIECNIGCRRNLAERRENNGIPSLFEIGSTASKSWETLDKTPTGSESVRRRGNNDIRFPLIRIIPPEKDPKIEATPGDNDDDIHITEDNNDHKIEAERKMSRKKTEPSPLLEPPSLA